jgi:hypothetical protein
VRSLHFNTFSASFLITFLSPEIATSINMHVPFSLSQIIMSGLLLGIVLSVCTCWFHSIVTLLPWFVTTDFGTCSYQCFLSSCTHISLHMLNYYYYYYYVIWLFFKNVQCACGMWHLWDLGIGASIILKCIVKELG